MRFDIYAWILGWTILVTSYIINLYIFVSAYFSEGKMVRVYINHFGEANFEMGMFLLTAPFVVWVVIRGARSLRELRLRGVVV